MSDQEGLNPPLPGSIDTVPKRATLMKWQLLFAISAECFAVQYVPRYYLQNGVDVAATLVNLVGTLLEGFFRVFEEQSSSESLNWRSVWFRQGFLSVLTTYSYAVDHGAHLMRRNGVLAGQIYFLLVFGAAFLLYELGRSIAFSLFPKRKSWAKTKQRRLIVRAFIIFLLFNILTILTSCWIPYSITSYVIHPEEGAWPMYGALELIIGCAFSVLSVVATDGLYSYTFSRSEDIKSRLWGFWSLNFMACTLLVSAHFYVTRRPLAKDSALLLKFISSFCGSLSCFSCVVADIVDLWRRGQRKEASQSFMAHLGLGVSFIFLLGLFSKGL